MSNSGQETAPVWLEDAPEFESAALPAHSSAVVCGAGLAGVWTALELQRNNCPTVLIESQSPAQGASGRNAGQLIAALPWDYQRAIEHLGRDGARSWRTLMKKSIERLDQEIAGCRSDVQFMRTGSLACAIDDAERRSLEASAQLLREDGFEAEFWTADQLTKRYGVSHFKGALFQSEDATLNPARLVWILLKRFQSLGGTYVRSTLDAIVPKSDQLLLHCNTGQVTTPALVLCTNAWTSKLLPEFSNNIRAVAGQILATTKQRKVFALAMTCRGGAEYWRQSEKGTVLIGGCRDKSEHCMSDPADRQLDAEIHRSLNAFRLYNFPKLAEADVSGAWVGPMALTQDGLPLAGAVPKMRGAWILAGFNGCGLVQIPELAACLAADILGARSLPAQMSPGRFQSSSVDSSE